MDYCIIVPYRDRQSHLDDFISKASVVFKKYIPNFKIIIVEQTDSQLFNRGKLLNVAINEYKDMAKYFITHDIDMIPTENTVKEHYLNNDFDVYIISSPHNRSLGQVCKFTRDCLIDVNGLPYVYSNVVITYLII